MKGHYILEDVSWWDSNGCDCCESIFCEAYNFKEEHLSCLLGTQSSIENVAIELLIINDIIHEDYYEEEEDVYYIKLAKDNGITWEIV